MEYVILVDEQGNSTGTMEKMQAHREGVLHRAFSIFIFNDRNELLLQRRAVEKYHSGGLWTNSCCSHPRPDEFLGDAASRRLAEELGFTTRLEEVFSFTYHASFDNGLTEHEFDHVLVGYYSGTVSPNPSEVEGYAWWSMQQVADKLHADPGFFTAWFRIVFPRIAAWWQHNTALV